MFDRPNARLCAIRAGSGLVRRGFHHHICPQACWSPAAAPGRELVQTPCGPTP
ncbi:hypothetical protein USDA257_c57470 [Sinorhizobium fredii USDA 257]|uniref:Uncharacterized protein n=1 Tax=Sinorhizobium fredii (strain USDA 257) TaxID=1185652 RepID=I3XEF2_SINF2|nr:hypothetical protein USDA257_c57470 [Sinorhizobium fredii USDA 257]